MQNVDRYLKVAIWARKRYTEGGRLVFSIAGNASRFARIEMLAWNRYMKGGEA